jgi:phage-related protein
MAWQDSDTTGGKVRLKHSQVAAETIGPSGLVPGEIAINSADGKIVYKATDGTVKAIPTGLTQTFLILDENQNTLTLNFTNGLLTSVVQP